MMLWKVVGKVRPLPNSLLRPLCTATRVITNDPANNVSLSVAAKVGKNLHLRVGHPLNIIKERIEVYFQEPNTLLGQPNFQVFDDLPPVVSVYDNFDSLLIPVDHGQNSFLVCGDVYRRDEIDRSHYPVFHQMEGVRVFRDDEVPPTTDIEARVAIVSSDLKNALEGLARHLFGDVEMRWVDAYFPFTHHSAELEILFRGDWMEVLGCGVIQEKVMQNSGRQEETGWAFGLGLERLAMVLFSIPDIRLFWSDDERFTSQFKAGTISQFTPYSKYPPCFKDVSFWLPREAERTFHNNDMFEVVRDVAGDLVEEVQLVDTFVHPKTQRQSNCFRITYRSMSRSLTNEEVDKLQERVRQDLISRLCVELRYDLSLLLYGTVVQVVQLTQLKDPSGHIVLAVAEKEQQSIHDMRCWIHIQQKLPKVQVMSYTTRLLDGESVVTIVRRRVILMRMIQYW